MSLKSVTIKIFSVILGLFWPFFSTQPTHPTLRGLDGIEIIFFPINCFLVSREVDFTFL